MDGYILRILELGGFFVAGYLIVLFIIKLLFSPFSALALDFERFASSKALMELVPSFALSPFGPLDYSLSIKDEIGLNYSFFREF